MNNEQIKKEKYICNFNEVTVADLFIKMTNGMRQVTLKRGEYLPVDDISFDDLRKSRLHGCLKRLLDTGYIVVEGSVQPPVENVKVKLPSLSKGINEIAAGIIKSSELTNPVSTAVEPVGIDPFPEERALPVQEIISEKDSKTVNTFAISETAITKQIMTYSNFLKLRYFQKLKAIKDMKDKELLTVIIENDAYPQLTHNAQLRLKEIGNGT